MRSIIIAVVICVFAFAKANAQKLSGVATYQTQRSVDIKMDSTSGMKSDMQKSIQEQLRKQFQKEYSLTFTSDESLWKEVPKLDTPQAPSSSGIQIRLSGNSDVSYRNIKEQRYVNQSDLMGKLFLVSDSISKQDWKLEKEVKNIGQYMCFKATYTEEYKSSSFVTGDEEPEVEMKTRVTTAWYTLDIPVQLGPDRFWGLPGLILEVNDGKMSMMCTKVVLNPKEEIIIDIPSKGKKVSGSEFEKISEEKSKEMMERYRSKSSKKGDGNSFSISIQG